MRSTIAFVYCAAWLLAVPACGGRDNGTSDDGGTGGECRNAGDCAGGSEVCVSGRCIPVNCTDLSLSGNETDVDCGGECPACTEGQRCSVAFDCSSQFCDGSQGDAVCRDCSSVEDCAGAGDAFCDNGVCVTRAVDGSSCNADDDCSSRHCVDGVCCQSACNGACEMCGSDGQCVAVAAGDDPDGDCDEGFACGQTGACDGLRGCQLAESGASCPTESCSGGGTGTCDGAGVCQGGAGDCNPFTCNGGVACFTSCPSLGDSTACAAGNYCDGANCVAKQASGAQCTVSAECTSGNCVDGFCCNNACNSSCKSCRGADTGLANGTCGNVLPAAGAQTECPAQAASTCGRTGLCESGSCQLFSNTTTCQGQSCGGGGNGTLTPAKTCNGSGSCVGPASSSCSGNYQCANATSCRTSCSTTDHCQPGFACVDGMCEVAVNRTVNMPLTFDNYTTAARFRGTCLSTGATCLIANAPSTGGACNFVCPEGTTVEACGSLGNYCGGSVVTIPGNRSLVGPDVTGQFGTPPGCTVPQAGARVCTAVVGSQTMDWVLEISD